MIRSYVVTAAVCAGALLLAPLGAASSALGAPGDLVTVTGDRGAAPLVQPGLHPLDLPGDGWLEVHREDPANTLWIGESLVTPLVNNGEHFVTVHDTEGDCSWSGPDSVGQELVQVQLRAGGTKTEECAGGSVWVEHDLTSATDYAGTTARLAVWEEPAATADDLPEASRRVAWRVLGVGDDVVDRDLGTDFTDAPELPDGRYNVQVAPGVPALFAVQLDWGQHLQLEMSLPEGNTAEAPVVRPRLINPLGITSDWATAVGDSSGTSPLQDTYLLIFPGVPRRAAGSCRRRSATATVRRPETPPPSRASTS
ncbi:hypothetical protein [Nocardioides alcanivorans]|uniref:hypothetical protein n=1 Tax=Nocardioides alcanivorans TaxID=2897352 RepID=UPI001F15B44E|nr:hypothetical protein [Nocardioides alcanivorans]